MTAINFPASPTNGQVFTDGDKTWTYSTSVGAWKLQTQTSAGATGATGAGVVTGGTIGQVLAKNSSTAFDTTWASIGSAARPLVAEGAYLSGSGLVVSALTGNYASTPDSGPLSITGDIDIQARVTMPDWTPVGLSTITGKWNTSNLSYVLTVFSTGVLRLFHSADGTTNIITDSTVATGFADGATKWIRVTLDVDNGSSQRVAKFYTSDNGTAWTQLGTTVTTAGTTSIFDGTAPLEFGATNLGTANLTTVTVHRAIIRNGYDGAGSVVFDADFSTQTADALAFNATSDSGIKADGLVLKGQAVVYATTPDSAALSITGDIDIKTKVTLSNWSSPGSTGYIVSKTDGGSQRSYYLRVLSGGVLQFHWSPTGLFADIIQVSSTAGFSIADGGTKWVRATMDVNDGSGNRVIKFYTSDDGTSWTQLGTTITAAGTTSIFNGTAILTIGGTEQNLTPIIGTVHRAIIQSAYDTADNTTSLAFDADFDAQIPETTSFAESSSNAAIVTMLQTNPTVTINTTRYSYGIPNAQSGTISTASLAAGSDRYQRFVVTKPTVVDMVLMEVTTGPASAATVYFGLYAADTNFQPTGNVLLATDIAVGSGATGVFRKQVTPVTLPAGTYLFATNPSVTMTVRTLINGGSAMVSTYGASGSINTLSRTRTAATFGNSPSAWNTVTAGSTVGSINYALLRWREAT